MRRHTGKIEDLSKKFPVQEGSGKSGNPRRNISKNRAKIKKKEKNASIFLKNKIYKNNKYTI